MRFALPRFMKDVIDLLGRIFLSFIFLYEAADSIFYFKHTKETMISYGVTWNTEVLLVGAIFVLLLGSFLVLIGYYAHVGSFLLLCYWLPFSLIVYSFWNDPEDLRRMNALFLMRNLAVCGGLLILMANGATGKYSVKRLIHVMRLPK